MASVDAGEFAFRRRRSLPLAFRQVAAVVHLTDAVLITLASVATGCVYRWWTSSVVGEIDQFAATGALFAVLVVGLNVIRGSSRPEELLKPAKQIRNAALAWLFALFVTLGMAFAWKVSSDFSRGALATFFLAGLALTVANRLLWTRVMQVALQKERLKARRAAVLFSASEDRGAIIEELHNLRRHGYLPLWQIAMPEGVGEGPSRLPDMLRGTNVEEVIILCDWPKISSLIDLKQLAQFPVPVRYLPIGSAKRLCERPRETLGGSTLVELQRGSLSGAERMAKVTFDKGVAAASLILLVPFLALIALLIKVESRGPVFFRQTRRGFNGLPFEIWKFRTMAVAENGAVVRQAVQNDPRVTRVGRLLRRASLDELPQLINVLRGEMSIVGPRPHALSHDDHYDGLIANYPMRQHVLPGLTGWAQVRGARGETPTLEHMRQRVEYDLWYVQNWSFKRDVWIILYTVWHVLTTRTAY